MLSLSKLRVGQEAYQLSGVAESLDAYYTGAGEAAGVWVGGGAARLGLEGEVAAADLRAVLAGMAPGSGGLSPNGTTIKPRKSRVPGFDATFKVPKSASVLYAVSDDPRVQGAIIDAGEHAVREAVAWLEREAIEVQRGSHNMAWVEKKRAELIAAGEDAGRIGPHRLKTSGVAGAVFRHRTSRDCDPLLHWHVLIPNLVEGTDGKWSAFAHPDLFWRAKAAGELFQAVFRAELSRTLGVEWRPGKHVPEIAGIPQGLSDLFSKRRAEIDAWLEATGTPPDAAGQQAAVLATRRHKLEKEGEERLDAGWKVEARDWGWGPAQADELIAELQPRGPVGVNQVWRLAAVGFDEAGTPERYERVVTPAEWISDLLRRDLTVHATTFTDADVVEAVAQRLGGGSTVDTLERIVNIVLGSNQVIPVASDDGREWYTSREIRDVEQRFIAALDDVDERGPLDPALVATAVGERPNLGEDQAAAVARVCGSDANVAVLIGPAGTGKTYTLDTVRQVFERSGWRVIGAGPSARAARELTAGAQIPARTLHTLAGDVARGLEELDGRTLLVVDEAGMADIRLLEETVTTTVARGGRVLLVGDQHQMPAIGAGGGFAYAAEHGRRVAELTVNRRQREPWEQQALAELRNRSVATAVAAYREHGRVVVTADADTMVADAIGRWIEAIEAGQRPVMLAGSNDLVDRLNRAAIDVLVARGELPDDSDGTYGGERYRVGARVTLRRNSDRERTAGGERFEVANGQLGTVIAVDGGRLTVRLDRHPDVEVVLDERYLARGGQISHGYALTTHRAQGGTWDLSITVGVDGLYREAAYTDLSRGIAENWLVIPDLDLARLLAEADTDVERHDTGIDPDEGVDVDEELVERMSTSRAKHLAHSIDPDLDAADELARSRPLAELEERLAAARQAARVATRQHGYSDQQLRQQLAAVEHTAHRIALGVRVRPADRHNVGTVTAIDDDAGQGVVWFVSPDGREADKVFGWQHLVIIDRGVARHDLSPAAEASLGRIRAGIDRRRAVWSATVTALGSYPAEDEQMDRAIRQHIAARTARLAGAQPDWLDQLIGPRPADPVGAGTWDGLVAEIARWRSRYNITGDGIRPAPADVDQRAVWQQLNQRLAATRSWLHTADRHEPSWPAVRSHAELIARRRELDAILDTAPDDTRPVIAAVRAGQLALTDVDEILRQAGEGRDARKHWILEHWPHVVEYAEVTTTLREGRWGPDARRLLGQLDEEAFTPALATAIDDNEPWLQAALCAIDADDDTPLTAAQVDWLNDVADHRRANEIGSRDPLGPIPTDRTELTQFDHLLNGLHHARRTPEHERDDLDLGVDM
jgi:conjugative relaxase-like TrwC/TraI family protein